jgi:uncharacterized protein
MFDMQRIFPLKWFQLFILFALYVSGFASATADTIPPKPVPHIALLLPTGSPDLGAAANAVEQGFMAAAKTLHAGLPIRLYSDFDATHSVVDAYNAAVNNGAIAVVGPLTRDDIRKLAAETRLPVPTLALNVIEGQAPRQMYFFGLAIEAEAQQVARLARKQKLKQAIVVSNDDPLARRLQYAFEEQWTALGGIIAREIDFNNDAAVFADIAPEPDSMVFLATDIEKSRLIRPYLPASLPVFATSQIFSGNSDTLVNFDLDGIRFVDMPWLMQMDQPAISAYPRSSPPLPTDQERLYALGIDSYSLIQILLANQTDTALPFDGVTGVIKLENQTFVREALPSLFVQGHAQWADAPPALATPMFPGQVKSASGVDAASSVLDTPPVDSAPIKP